MKWEAISFHASWKKAFRTEATVNKAQVISVWDRWDNPHTTGLMNLMLSASEGYRSPTVR